MPQFAYTAVDRNGQPSTGTLVAETRAAALDEVVRKGLNPVQVEQGKEGAPQPHRALPAHGRVSQASAEAFTRELANLLAAGVSLSRGLHILSREASNAAAKRQWGIIHDDVMGGMPLADAMARFPKSFPPVHVAMVRAGETGGFLDVVLQQISDFRSRERDLKSKVKSALAYPAVLAVLATGVLIFLMTFFIPRFSKIFDQFGGTLPVLTKAIMLVSTVLTKYGIFLLVAIVLGALVLRRAMHSESGKRAFERLILRVPSLGRVLARFALVRFSRMLGTLIGAGVPLVTALRVAREAIGNQTLADAVNRSIEEVQKGAPLARSLAGTPQLFPPSVTEMVAVAEESGRLDQELVRLAASYEGELDRQLRTMVALAEPALLFVMAAIVGTVVIGMLLPVFMLQDYIH